MASILVGMDSEMTHMWAFIYALNLAKRMQLNISVLLVTGPSGTRKEKKKTPSKLSPIKVRLEKLIANGRLEGLSIDYYLACGTFKDELIKFIQEKRINLLVIDFLDPGRKIGGDNFQEILEEIKLRTDCRIEVVHKKNIVKSG